VGGTGLFQIAENYLQITGRFPNPKAQVKGAKIGIAHSVGGPGNNVYVTIIESTDSRRQRQPVQKPRLTFESSVERSQVAPPSLHGARGLVKAATSIYVTAGGTPGPVHVALLEIDGRRVFARLDHALGEGERIEELLAGETVKLLVKGDGDHYFQLQQRGTGFTLARIVSAIRRRVARDASVPPPADDTA
jgi:hypothetical protein